MSKPSILLQERPETKDTTSREMGNPTIGAIHKLMGHALNVPQG